MTVLVLCVPDVTCDVQWWTSEDECKLVLRHMIRSPETNMASICIYIINDLITFEYINKGPLTMLTLCTLGPLCSAWLFFHSSSCSILPPSLLGLDCLSNSLSGWPGPPSPLPLGWPHFPQVPGNTLPLCRTHCECTYVCISRIKICKIKVIICKALRNLASCMWYFI
jgi:hypothetical protein